MTLEEAFKELRDANTQWSIKCLELKQEIEKRDRILNEAKILLTANTHKLSQEEWLKQYEEMRVK